MSGRRTSGPARRGKKSEKIQECGGFALVIGRKVG